MSIPTYNYCRAESDADLERARSGDPSCWFYDEGFRLRVDPKEFGARAGPNVWSHNGWDQPPTRYPATLARQLEDATPAPQSQESPKPKRRGRRKSPVMRPVLGKILRTWSLPAEAVEKIDLLCEAYRMRPSQVMSRLIDEAYRRDVVDSGMLAVLKRDADIISHIR